MQSLIPRWSDADDALQRCNLVLWKKFDQYEPGWNFFAWGCQIVRLGVMKFRERASRDQLVFSEEFVDKLAENTVLRSDELGMRIEYLQQCIAKLAT